MARKKKNHGDNDTSSVGGFVPASPQSGHSHQGGRNSIEFDHTASTVLASPDAPVSEVALAQYSRTTADYANRKQSGMSRGAKIAIAIVIIALVAGISALGFYIYKEMQKETVNQDLHSLSQEEMEAVDNELTGMTTFDEPFTLLLLGSDARADDPDMGARTDTIILVRVDPVQNIVSMVSIPRDTKITIPGAGTQKFNAAYTYGGPSGTIAAVKELCGVDIDHYAEINFEGLVGLVDAIGGIDVFVDEAIDDPAAGPVVIPAGEQHLDGAAALTFSRSRDYADGDFTRVSNQRKVIQAIINKGLNTPATELYGLVKASAAFMTTDTAMDVDFIYSLADQLRHNHDYPFHLYTATIPSSTDSIDGVSYVVADEQGVEEMMEVFVIGGDVSGGSDEVVDEEAAEDGAGSAGSAGAAGGAAGTGAGTGAGAAGGAAGTGAGTGSTGSGGSTTSSSVIR